MAEPQILYFNQRAVLCKLEAVADTDPVLSPSTDGFRFYDGSTGTEFDKIERNPDRPFWGGNPFKVANKRAFIEGNFDLFPPAAPGTTGAHCKPLILPAGFAEVLSVPNKTARYNPISSAIPAAWSRFYQGGEEVTVQSGRHNLNAIAFAIGAGASANVRMQGTYTTIPEQAAPNVPTNDTQSIVATWDNSVAFLDYAPGTVSDLPLRMRSLSVDLGADLATTEFTGKRISGHRGRTPTATAVLLRPRDSDINLHAVRDAGGIIEVRFRTYESDAQDAHYSELGVRMQIEQIQRQDIEGYYGYQISGPCIPSASGGDELYIEFGDVS